MTLETKIKDVLRVCRHYESIINYQFKQGDILSKYLIESYQSEIFNIDSNDLKKMNQIKVFDIVMHEYVSDSKLYIPARISEEISEKIREIAKKAYKTMGCGGLSRIDFFVEKHTNEIYLNEINTFPGFTAISMYPKLFEKTGIPYAELIDRLIKLAFERAK